MYRCPSCKVMSIPDDNIVKVEGNETVFCPLCKMPAEKQCDMDHACKCAEEIQGGIHFCPKCGATICKCGSHDCLGISRITGYMQPTFGWNAGKAQELKDRKHYEVT